MDLVLQKGSKLMKIKNKNNYLKILDNIEYMFHKKYVLNIKTKR